jgi:SOS-response transcriptional repressor LexA
VKNYTPRQLEILHFLIDYRNTNECSPTLEEIGEELGVHRVTIHQHIDALEKMGAVIRGPGHKRNIQVVDRELFGDVPDNWDLLGVVLEEHLGHAPMAVIKDPNDSTVLALECQQCKMIVFRTNPKVT